MSLAAYAKRRLTEAGLELAFPERTTFKEFAVRVGRSAKEAIARRARTRRASRLRARPRLRRARRRAARRRHRAPHARRTSTGSSRRWRPGEADLREVAGRPPRGRAAALRPSGRRGARRSCAVPEPPRLPELAEPEILRHFTELSTRNFGIDTGFYPLGSCTMKYNPRVNERLVMTARLPRPASVPGRGCDPGRARADVAAPGGADRGLGPPCVLAAAGRRLAGGADRADADARVLRGPWRGRSARHDHHRRHGARHESRERHDGRLQAREGADATRAATSTSRTCGSW